MAEAKGPSASVDEMYSVKADIIKNARMIGQLVRENDSVQFELATLRQPDARRSHNDYAELDAEIRKHRKAWADDFIHYCPDQESIISHFDQYYEEARVPGFVARLLKTAQNPDFADTAQHLWLDRLGRAEDTSMDFSDLRERICRALKHCTRDEIVGAWPEK